MLRWMTVAALLLGSCASAPAREPVRIAVVEITSRVTSWEPDYASLAREYLDDALLASGRFRLLERRHLESVLEQSGKEPIKAGWIAGAEWIVYGAVTEAVIREEKGSSNPPRKVAEVEVQLRVVRVQTGEILYSKHPRGTFEGSMESEPETLLRRATKLAIEQAAMEIAKLNP